MSFNAHSCVDCRPADGLLSEGQQRVAAGLVNSTAAAEDSLMQLSSFLSFESEGASPIHDLSQFSVLRGADLLHKQEGIALLLDVLPGGYDCLATSRLLYFPHRALSCPASLPTAMRLANYGQAVPCLSR